MIVYSRDTDFLFNAGGYPEIRFINGEANVPDAVAENLVLDFSGQFSLKKFSRAEQNKTVYVTEAEGGGQPDPEPEPEPAPAPSDS
jgi:hypothetical protein